MPYEPMSFETFRQRVLSGRYKSAQAARRAVTLTTWDSDTKASAVPVIDEFFSSSDHPSAGRPTAFDGHAGLATAMRNLELLVGAAEMPPRSRRSLEASVAAVRDALRLRGASAAPTPPVPVTARKQVSPKVRPLVPSVPETRPKQDLSKLMEGEVDDPGEDDDDEEGGHQNGTSTHVGADDVDRMLTLHPDFEGKIAEMEASAPNEKERTVARTLGNLVREQAAKGVFHKK